MFACSELRAQKAVGCGISSTNSYDPGNSFNNLSKTGGTGKSTIINYNLLWWHYTLNVEDEQKPEKNGMLEYYLLVKK